MYETEIPDRPRSRDQAITMSRRGAALAELEASVVLALETYANVHRGAGYNSMASTLLYGQARNTVLSACGLDRRGHTVVFCTPDRAAALEAAVGPDSAVILSSGDLGLPLGLRAVIVRSRSLPKGLPFQTGGGTAKLVSRRSVVWEDAPDRWEAGTPPVINAITLARALEIARHYGIRAFDRGPGRSMTPRQILYQDDLLEFSGRELLRRLRLTTLGRRRLVPTDSGLSPYIHFDNAASTPTFLPVWNAVREAWRSPEEQGPELVAEVRTLCAEFFGAPADRYDVIFTSNATEAINLAAQALAGKPPLGRVPAFETVVLNSSVEHNSNELPWRFADRVSLLRMPVDDEGFPDLRKMERLLREYNDEQAHGRERIRIVAVSGASNVLGACPDLAAISRIAHRYQALVLVDAAQLAGHRAVRMAADELDGLAFSGHKMYAPFGAGGLILKKGLWPAADARFEAAKASGEENLAGLTALGKAINLLQRIGMDIVRDEESRLTRTVLREMRGLPGVRIYGLTDPDSPRMARRLGVISFEMRGAPHNLAAEELAETAGIGVRTGCHCAHILVKRLLRIPPAREALAELGLKIAPRITKSLLPGILRISLGLENEGSDARRLAAALERIAARRRPVIQGLLAKTHNAAPVVRDTETRRRMRAAMEREAASVYGPVPAGPAEGVPPSPALVGRRRSSVTTFIGQPCCRKI